MIPDSHVLHHCILVECVQSVIANNHIRVIIFINNNTSATWEKISLVNNNCKYYTV